MERSRCSPWQLPLNQEQLPWEMMELTIVMAKKGGVIRSELCGDLNLIEGGGLEHRWCKSTHLNHHLTGSGAEVFESADSVLSHPIPQLLGGPVGDGILKGGLRRPIGDSLQFQATVGVQQHGKQCLAAANGR